MFSAFHKLTRRKYDIVCPYLHEITHTSDNVFGLIHRYIQTDDSRFRTGDSAAKPTYWIK